jgi:uncharacterized membrane protein
MEGSDLSRTTAFSDGVIAVAITLLVLNIEIPDVPGTSASELWDELGDVAPNVAVFAFSFALIGRYWVVHHRLFERLSRIDGRLMALNLGFLALIALMPFAASLLGDYGDLAPACAVFGSLLTFASLTHQAMAKHAVAAGLEARPVEDPSDRTVALVIPLIYALSVPVAFLSTIAAQALWVGSIFVRFPLRKRS